LSWLTSNTYTARNPPFFITLESGRSGVNGLQPCPLKLSLVQLTDAGRVFAEEARSALFAGNCEGSDFGMGSAHHKSDGAALGATAAPDCFRELRLEFTARLSTAECAGKLKPLG